MQPNLLPSATREAFRLGTGPTSIFLHANAFPPGAYTPLLEALSSRLQIRALALRPLNSSAPPTQDVQWSDLGADTNRYLATHQQEPVIAIGHSMGATALITAVAAEPWRYRALVLIEPAMVTPAIVSAIQATSYRERLSQNPARATLRKRDQWADVESFQESCARSGLYNKLSPESMVHLIDALLFENEEGVSLRYPKQWEAHLYTCPPDPTWALSKLTVPVIGLRGSPTLYLTDECWKSLRSALPSGWFRQHAAYGHLLPLEAPQTTADSLLSGLEDAGLIPRVVR